MKLVQAISLSVVLLVLPLGGCSHLMSSITDPAVELTGAKSLDTSNVPQAGDNVVSKDYIGRLLNESEENCRGFVARLSVGERATDLFLDLQTTIAAALATAFTPPGTSHALSAIATIASGSKGAIDSDLYARETAPLIVQAIQNSYYKDYKAYVTTLSGRADNIIPAIEVAQIKSLHAECTLDSAIATLSANNQQSVTPAPPAPQTPQPNPTPPTSAPAGQSH